MLSNGLECFQLHLGWSYQDLFLIKYDKIITMSEVTDEQMIGFYNRYLNEDDIDIEIDGQVTLNDKMGLLTTVEDVAYSLRIYLRII